MTPWHKVSNQYFDKDDILIRVSPKRKKDKKAAKAVEALLNYYIKHHTAEFFRDVLTAYNIDQAMKDTSNVTLNEDGKITKRKGSYGGTI